jgi:hypothetical protein
MLTNNEIFSKIISVIAAICEIVCSDHFSQKQSMTKPFAQAANISMKSFGHIYLQTQLAGNRR